MTLISARLVLLIESEQGACFLFVCPSLSLYDGSVYTYAPWSFFSHVWLFDGAEGGKWLQQLKKQLGIPRSIPPSTINSGYNTRSSTPVIGASPSKDGRETKKARIA